ncbi:hypothetical protein ACFSC6_11360 [Rufibacter sediminis]|uniref:Uncharacterized protein n=1 Tax=Rufibacter sediminis TaxID=2762756 RepID=A0ABR6VTJ8_9BACT|nr:hypothetical protein [Rufibacter sediminis]MBC3540476.1 hypothetical protein [Rufibacter sediminis]
MHYDEFSESSLLNIDPFIDEVKIFGNFSDSEALYIIKAVPWQDFTASFGFLDKDGQVLGYVARSTWVPELAAHYHIFNKHLQKVFTVREGAGMVRFSDTLFSRIPFLGFFSGYFFNPSYHVIRQDDTQVALLKKQKSFLARRFSVYRGNPFSDSEKAQIVLSLLLITIQERLRG